MTNGASLFVYKSGCRAPRELRPAVAPGLSGPIPLLLSTKELLRSIRLKEYNVIAIKLLNLKVPFLSFEFGIKNTEIQLYI